MTSFYHNTTALAVAKDPKYHGMSRPDPKKSIRGNRRVPLNRSQFLETQSKARKAFDILARLNNDTPPILESSLDLKK